MDVCVQINLIDYHSIPDGPYNYVLNYQDHGLKFFQLHPLTQKICRAMVLELIKIICIFGSPAILQANNGKKFSHGASKSCHIQLVKR
jgi:hypothetical protein